MLPLVAAPEEEGIGSGRGCFLFFQLGGDRRGRGQCASFGGGMKV